MCVGQPPLVIGLGPDTGACSGHVSTRVCGDRSAGVCVCVVYLLHLIHVSGILLALNDD